MEEKQTLYGFWYYDICPFMLGGIIEKFGEDGYIYPKGYRGMGFKPVAILPDDTGKEALKELKVLRYKWNELEQGLKLEYRNKARKLVGLDPVKPKE